MWKSLLCPDMDCAALQSALGSGMGAGAWAASVVLLLAWGKLLPSPDLGYPPVLCSPIPWHPDRWQKPAPSQKYHNGWKCCSAVLAFDVGKDYMPPAGATVVSLKAFYGQWQLGCAACSPIPVHPSDPILAPSPVRKHVETSNFLF